jgi:hypothetical protein
MCRDCEWQFIREQRPRAQGPAELLGRENPRIPSGFGRLLRVQRLTSAPRPVISTGVTQEGHHKTVGLVWSLPATGGMPTKLGPGDSLTVEPETGDLIVKLDEGTRMRLVRLNAAGGYGITTTLWRFSARAQCSKSTIRCIV